MICRGEIVEVFIVRKNFIHEVRSLGAGFMQELSLSDTKLQCQPKVQITPKIILALYTQQYLV